jgi:alkanesulfonate monooxygenase SsuD/methylene tetrahydromethanopterin reductase-like flavin-dependent oxidoreductase (luciferase family)
MWTWVTDDRGERTEWVARLAGLLDRQPTDVAGRVLVGPPEACAALLSAYAAAGVDLMLVWPVADHERQLERLMREVVPLVRSAAGP